jgi:hypothetical protein
MPENTPIYNVWSLVYNQLIVAGMGDAIAINHLAIWAVLDRLGERLGVKDKNDCFIKINHAYSVLCSERNKKRKLGQTNKVTKKAGRH